MNKSLNEVGPKLEVNFLIFNLILANRSLVLSVLNKDDEKSL